jgi:hypothetical protein
MQGLSLHHFSYSKPIIPRFRVTSALAPSSSAGWLSHGQNSRSKQTSKEQQHLRAAAAAAAAAAAGSAAGPQAVLELQQGSVLAGRVALAALHAWEACAHKVCDMYAAQ